MEPPYSPRFAFNPDERWLYDTDPNRPVRSVIRVRKPGPWQMTTTANVAVWDDPSRAGLNWDTEETNLQAKRLDERYAVVVGELHPRAAATPDGEHLAPSFGQHETYGGGCLRRRFYVVPPASRNRCVLVRLIGTTHNAFYILVDKDPTTKICGLRNTPAQEQMRRYIAFYDEWGGHCTYVNLSPIRQYVKDEIQSVCNKLREHFKKYPRSSATDMPEFPRHTGCGHPGHEIFAKSVRQRPVMLPTSQQPLGGDANNNAAPGFLSTKQHTAAQFSPLTDTSASVARIFGIGSPCSEKDIQKVTVHLNEHWRLALGTDEIPLHLMKSLTLLLRDGVLGPNIIEPALRGALILEWYRLYILRGNRVWKSMRRQKLLGNMLVTAWEVVWLRTRFIPLVAAPRDGSGSAENTTSAVTRSTTDAQFSYASRTKRIANKENETWATTRLTSGTQFSYASVAKKIADAARVADEELKKLAQQSDTAEQESAVRARQCEAAFAVLGGSSEDVEADAPEYLRLTMRFARMSEKKHATYCKTTLEQVKVLLESIQSDCQALEHPIPQANQ